MYASISINLFNQINKKSNTVERHNIIPVVVSYDTTFFETSKSAGSYATILGQFPPWNKKRCHK